MNSIDQQPTKTDRVLICLPSEEASALVDLGAALEPFITVGSPADKASAKMDEQVAHQARTYGDLVDCVTESLFMTLDGLLPPHVTERDVEHASRAAIDQVLGYYGDDE